jgi:dCMP deaminase
MRKLEQWEWDNRFLRLAQQVSEWSKDHAKVGAVIVDKRNRVVALGYNGFPTDVADTEERLTNDEQKNDMVVHAEENAVLIAGRAAEGGTIYVSAKPVCSRCAGVIIQSGITRVVAPEPRADNPSKWHSFGLLAIQMFVEATVEFVSAESVPAPLNQPLKAA